MISDLLHNWYLKNSRDLPWRKSADPYRIWLSEIILQQTRVDQGLPYYNKFVDAFPSIHDLANASEDVVLKLWQGLGYYSRARNLHATAKIISQNYKGQFPNSYPEILKLKGIGPYTAAAIASIAFNLPQAVVDGNVIRVLSRLFDMECSVETANGKALFQQVAQSIIPHKTPGLHNQSMMELGSLICSPKSPNCNICPVSQHCLALKNNTIHLRPTKKVKRLPTNRFFNYLWIENKGNVLLGKRDQGDIWTGLYQFPLIESNSILSEPLSIQNLKSKTTFLWETKHILTHQHLFVRFYKVKISDNEKTQLWPNYEWIPLSLINQYPVPRLIHLFLEHIDKNGID